MSGSWGSAQVVVVQSLNYIPLFVTPMDCSVPGFPVLHYFLQFAGREQQAVQSGLEHGTTSSNVYNL